MKSFRWFAATALAACLCGVSIKADYTRMPWDGIMWNWGNMPVPDRNHPSLDEGFGHCFGNCGAGCSDDILGGDWSFYTPCDSFDHYWELVITSNPEPTGNGFDDWVCPGAESNWQLVHFAEVVASARWEYHGWYDSACAAHDLTSW